MNFMEMSLNGFLWLDLNSVFLFSNLHLKMATITHNLSQKWHPNKAVFQRKFRKIASVDYRMSIWHLPWLLSECNSPKWVARVQFAACWEILRGPLHTVDRLPRKKNKWQCLRKENMVLNSLWTFYCSTRKSTLKQRRGWFCYTFTLNDFLSFMISTWAGSPNSLFLLLYHVSSTAEGKCGGGNLKPKDLVLNPVSAVYGLYDQWFLRRFYFLYVK